MAKLGALVDEHRITFMSSVPTVWRVALKTSRPPVGNTLKRVFCGSAPLTESMWKEIQVWAGTREVLNVYGITETSSWLAGTTMPEFDPETGMIGCPWGAIVKVLKCADTSSPPWLADERAKGEEGYVWVNTPALMKGYLERDDLTQQVVSQGWFSTGDVGVIDERGVLYLRGRAREEINKGGMKVHPGDIDSVVERFNGALDVCSFGFEDPLYGQDIGIAVVLDKSTEQELRQVQEWTRLHLAAHKVPTRWYLVNEIPRTSRGKVNRVTVSDECLPRHAVILRAERAKGST
jgi:acyl-CoA synthetase (AMP-forming)/AMP-acid ligase II